ncbi:Crp/Fnr family transcriptional regulator [Erythrobacter sp. HKB08]|uniref:Crp/Fnr family transcriptional regulator n=1 Tax=Erythrobacter sp. HKB08 TaxID=2502843 RepID=UPI0013E8D1F7|nr:Crp/Fnr family transcriptional regulator [Erythrobacter sp. HKB08]
MLFSVLPEDLQEALRADAPLRSFSDGQLIQQRGDEAEGFWLIESGSVSVGQFLANGEFRGVALLGPGDSYGELAMFSKRPRVVDAISRGASTARLLTAPRFEAAIAARPDAMRAMLGALSQQQQELLDVIGGMRRGTSRARVAGLLGNLAGISEEPRQVAITQHELGDFLGLSRATANACLRELEKEGLIERSYGAITVRDAEALRLAALG